MSRNTDARVFSDLPNDRAPTPRGRSGDSQREDAELGTVPPSSRSPRHLALGGHSTSTSSWARARWKASLTQRLKREAPPHPARGRTQAQKGTSGPPWTAPHQPTTLHSPALGGCKADSLQPACPLLLGASGGPPGWEGGPTAASWPWGRAEQRDTGRGLPE